jgi:PAS domain S-box-containing protein
MPTSPSKPPVASELEDLRARLADAEELLRSIRNGEVDAVVVAGQHGEQVYTLSGADRVYRQLIDSMNDGAATLSTEGVILFCNGSFARILGRPPDQLVGTSLREHLGAGTRQALDAILGQARSEPVRLEINLETSEGHLVPVYLSASHLQGEGADLVFCVVLTDLSELKRHEQIITAERLARLILEQAAEAIVVCDEQGLVIRASEAALRLLDDNPLLRPFSKVCPLRRNISDPFDLAPVLQGQTLRNIEIVLDRQGVRVDLIVNAGPLVIGQQVQGCVVTLTDISERVRSEEIRARLEEQVNLGQKLESLGTLASGIAHDFNNLLGTIIGNTELATHDVGPNHAAMVSLIEIRKASDRAKDLVQRILTFGRERQQPRSVIPLRSVVEEALSLLRGTLPAGVEIAADFDAVVPTVQADASQIHQVLINLCTNAWHAMDGNAGHIDIRLEGVTLDADAARADANLRPGHYARLSVIDSGKGMDTATMQRVFDPFFTTKPAGQGTGLGLSIVHGIMKAHGGAVTVTSEPGRGATFSLYFPAVEAAEASAATESPAATPRPAGNGRHVLYLDDEEQLVFLVTRMLERLGYVVSGYTRAEEALAAVRADPSQFDLVVTDLNMPGMSGLDVAREVSRLRPDLPVVLASGYVTDELRAQALAAGVRQVIYKPNTVEELCDAVDRFASEPIDR